MTDDFRFRLIEAFDDCRSSADWDRLVASYSDIPMALEYLAKLQNDKLRMQQLPKVKAPKSLQSTVAKQIQGPIVSVKDPNPKKKSVSWWAYAVAASLFIAVAFAAFAFNGQKNDPKQQARVERPFPTIIAKDTIPEQPATVIAREELPLPGIQGTSVATKETLITPHSDPIDDQKWLGAKVIGELPPFEAVQVRMPLLFPMSELQSDETRKLIAAELTASPALRLDLFTKDHSKAIEHLTNAFKSAGVTVGMPSLTAEQIKRKLPVSIAIYTEAMSKDDWLTLFKKVNGLESFGNAHLIAATAADGRELKQLIGVDPTLIKRGNDSQRPIAEGTLGQVTQAMQKSKFAIMTTAAPNAGRIAPATSAEIKQYLDRKGERATNAIPMLIVVRAGG